MADNDPFPYVCHDCLLTGWISYCSSCYHTHSQEDLDLENRCPNCIDNPQ